MLDCLLNAMGVVLEVFGLFIALSGLVSLKRDLFPGRPLPAARAGAWVRRKLWRRPTNTVLGVAASMLGTISGSARVQVLPARPADDAPAEEWVPYLLRRVENAEELAEWRFEEGTKRSAGLDERINAERDERVREVARVETRVVTAVGGEDGRGLDETWWGLVMTLVGVVLQALADVV